MKLKIKTKVLQELVSKALKGLGNNKMVPITTFLGIELKNNRLILHTMDGTNYLDVFAEAKFEGNDFELVISAEQFSKLVSKTTSDTITLEVVDGTLNFTGNGDYKIEIPMDDGSFITFPKIPEKPEGAQTSEIQVTTIEKILKTNSKAVARTMEEPVYTGYLFADKVITTDSYVVCVNDIQLFEGKELFTEQFLQLLTLSDSENFCLIRGEGGELWAVGGGVEIYGSVLQSTTGEDYASMYPYHSIMDYVNGEFPSSCVISKSELSNILDRLSLFITPYDKNGLKFEFTDKGIVVSSKASTGVEMLAYSSSKDFAPFECELDIETLRSQISAQSGETINLFYGHESAIKMIDGKMTQIVSLLGE